MQISDSVMPQLDRISGQVERTAHILEAMSTSLAAIDVTSQYWWRDARTAMRGVEQSAEAVKQFLAWTREDLAELGNVDAVRGAQTAIVRAERITERNMTGAIAVGNTITSLTRPETGSHVIAAVRDLSNESAAAIMDIVASVRALKDMPVNPNGPTA